MAENETNGKKKATEVISFSINPFPEWKGATVTSSKYSKEYEDGKKYRFDLLLPVPGTDEQANEMYNLSISDLIAKGVNQNSHDESELTPLINGHVIERKGEVDADFLATMAKAAKSAHFREKKETKVSKARDDANTLASLKIQLGLPADATNEQITAAAAKLMGKGKK